MMHQAKLMNSTSLTSAKQEVSKALNELEADRTSTQRVYTNLTRIYDALADHPQASLVVDSTLAAQSSMQLLSDMVRAHVREEEVQWALGRVFAVACQASIRFQCQAGQIQMWNELFNMRSAHPQSIRVQEASLRASETLFYSNEFHATKLRPQQLLDDLLGVMDRFLRIQTPQRRAHRLVVLALRVLAALYSSPRPTGLMLFNGSSSCEGEKWAREISRRMLSSFAVFNREMDSIRVWIGMVLLLLRHHPAQTLQELFSPAPHKETTWWFIAVIEKWRPQAEVMSELLATLTHIFALPHNTIEAEKQVVLAEKLMLEQNLLEVVCGVVDHYRHSSNALVLLEAVRIVRQWSERPTLVPRMEACRSVQTCLLPVLTELLHLQSSPTALSQKYSVLVLEILLVLRHLAVSHRLHSVLVASESVQMSLKWLRSASAAGDRDDSDLLALVAREARNVLKLLGPGLDGVDSKTRLGSPRTALVASKAALRRQPRTEHVKPETVRIYRNGKR